MPCCGLELGGKGAGAAPTPEPGFEKLGCDGGLCVVEGGGEDAGGDEGAGVYVAGTVCGGAVAVVRVNDADELVVGAGAGAAAAVLAV